MIKVKLLSRMAGPEGNFPPGYILEIEKEIVKQLVDGGHAEIIEPEPVKEQKQESKPQKKAGGKK